MAELAYADIYARLEEIRNEEQVARKAVNARHDEVRNTNEALRRGELRQEEQGRDIVTDARSEEINARYKSDNQENEEQRRGALSQVSARFAQVARHYEQELQEIRAEKAASEGVTLQPPPPDGSMRTDLVRDVGRICAEVERYPAAGQRHTYSRSGRCSTRDRRRRLGRLPPPRRVGIRISRCEPRPSTDARSPT